MHTTPSNLPPSDTVAADVKSSPAPVAASSRRRAPKPADPSWYESLGPSGIGIILALVVLMGLLYQPQWYRLFRMWKNPDWSHGYLIVVFCIYMVHVRKSALLAAPRNGSPSGLGLILLGIATYAYFIYVKIGYPQDLSMLIVVMGLVLLIRRWQVLRPKSFFFFFSGIPDQPAGRVFLGFTRRLR